MNLAVPSNMKSYTVGFLLPGPRHLELSDKTLAANTDLHAAHLEDIKRNIQSGALIMAVPMLTPESPIVAMAVFRAGMNSEEASGLLYADPAIAAGKFRFEVHSAFFPSLDCIRVEY